MTLTGSLGAGIGAALNWTFGQIGGVDLLGFVIFGFFGLIALKWGASLEVVAVTMIPLVVILVTAGLLPLWTLVLLAIPAGLAVAMLFNKVVR